MNYLSINEETKMNLNHIKEIQLFSLWAKSEINKSVNFEINFWNHSFDDKESVSYRLWISDTINKQSETLEELVNELPKLKQFCLMKKELSL